MMRATTLVIAALFISCSVPDGGDPSPGEVEFNRLYFNYAVLQGGCTDGRIEESGHIRCYKHTGRTPYQELIALAERVSELEKAQEQANAFDARQCRDGVRFDVETMEFSCIQPQGQSGVKP